MRLPRPRTTRDGDTNDGAGPDRARVVEKVLAELREHLDTDRATNIGFPSTFDIDFTPLWPFFNCVLNNVGDPYQTSAFPANTKHLEREVIDTFADLLRASPDDRWGYVTTGGTEGNEYGLLLARTLLPDAITYHSQASHYSVAKILDQLRMPSVTVQTRPDGTIDYTDLAAAARAHRHRGAVVLANIGTTMTEAVDNVATIRAVLGEVPVRGVYVHADAALSGLPLALLPPNCRPGFDLADGADSISISMHKFMGCPLPAGVVVTRASLRNRVGAAVDYIGSADTTLTGSRSGHAPLLVWYALQQHGIDGLRARAEQARQVAAYAVARLGQVGWPAWRHPHAMTVVLDAPPEPVRAKWRLATSNERSHIVCLPGITAATIDAFIEDLTDMIRPAAVTPTVSPPHTVPAIQLVQAAAGTEQ